MANYNEILKHWHDTNAEELEELQFWLDDFITEDADSPEELAFQLTAYEQWGCIDFDGWIDDQLKIKLESLDDSELVSIHNEACSEYNYMDDYIFTDLDEMFCGCVEANGVEWLVNRVHFGDYHGGAMGYYQFNAYGNIKEEYPSYLINKDICIEALKEQAPELSEEARDVLIKMALELVRAGY